MQPDASPSGRACSPCGDGDSGSGDSRRGRVGGGGREEGCVPTPPLPPAPAPAAPAVTVTAGAATAGLHLSVRQAGAAAKCGAAAEWPGLTVARRIPAVSLLALPLSLCRERRRTIDGSQHQVAGAPSPHSASLLEPSAPPILPALSSPGPRMQDAGTRPSPVQLSSCNKIIAPSAMLAERYHHHLYVAPKTRSYSFAVVCLLL